MTFCGYNETMAIGLRTFVLGMIEAMEKRHASGVPMADVVRNELSDLIAMNQRLRQGGASGANILVSLMAINDFAQGVFSAAVPCSGDPKQFRNACQSFCEEFVDLVRDTEEKHKDELEALNAIAGNKPAIVNVADWLLGLSLSNSAAKSLELEST